MNITLAQAAAALVFAVATPLLAQAAPQKVEQLPRVVIAGKSQAAAQQQQMAIVQLPRVVIEGRSLNTLAATTQLAQAKPLARGI